MKPTDATLTLDAKELIQSLTAADLNPAEIAEIARRCELKGNLYLKNAKVIRAWSKGRANDEEVH